MINNSTGGGNKSNKIRWDGSQGSSMFVLSQESAVLWS